MTAINTEYAFTCDICGRQRTETNHWYIVFECHADGVEHVTSHPWNLRLARLAGAIHLCGMECLLKQITKSITKIGGQNGSNHENKR